MSKNLFYITLIFLVNCISFVYPDNFDSIRSSSDVFPLAASTQMILIITGNWQDSSGILLKYERNKLGEKWKQTGDTIHVTVGKAGLGWGIGLHGNALDDGPVKHEGDNKAPAGVFRLGTVFGYAPDDSTGWLNMPYMHTDSCTECVDDPGSKYYNTLVDDRKVTDKDWKSSEIMKLTDNEYKWGIFIDHNSMPRKFKGGSCIFMHILGRGGEATSGCSAMKETDLIGILHWLTLSSYPVLVQLPKKEYEMLKYKWELP
jgi:D-alanyl-D-alanine dipeptidase